MTRSQMLGRRMKRAFKRTEIKVAEGLHPKKFVLSITLQEKRGGPPLYTVRMKVPKMPARTIKYTELDHLHHFMAGLSFTLCTLTGIMPPMRNDMIPVMPPTRKLVF